MIPLHVGDTIYVGGVSGLVTQVTERSVYIYWNDLPRENLRASPSGYNLFGVLNLLEKSIWTLYSEVL